jgi:hypothetical protein
MGREIRTPCGVLSMRSEPERGGSYVWLREQAADVNQPRSGMRLSAAMVAERSSDLLAMGANL